MSASGAIGGIEGLAFTGIGLAFDLAILNIAFDNLKHLNGEDEHEHGSKHSENHDESFLGLLYGGMEEPDNKSKKVHDDYDIFGMWGF